MKGEEPIKTICRVLTDEQIMIMKINNKKCPRAAIFFGNTLLEEHQCHACYCSIHLRFKDED